VPKGFLVENHQLNALLDGLVRDVNANNDGVKTIRQTLISVERDVGNLEDEVTVITSYLGTVNIDGGSPESIYLATQQSDGGAPDDLYASGQHIAGGTP
jgi:hypothetical protein